MRKGSSNPNWRGGKTKCASCHKELAQRYSWRVTTRCKSCWILFHRGKNHSRWSGKRILSEKGKWFPPCRKCDLPTGDGYSKLCSKCYVGVERPQWKGGISRLQTLIRQTPENRLWTKQCLYRDKYKCLECGTKGALQVDHVVPLSFLLQKNKITSVIQARECVELFDLENGRTLCIPCHKKTNTYGSKALNYHGI